MSVMGVKIEQIDVPICNSFRPQKIMDQLCYTVDPNKYKDKINLKEDLSLSLLINFNEERQMAFEDSVAILNDNLIIIETIGNIYNPYF